MVLVIMNGMQKESKFVHDKNTETAYNLWARHVDRPAEWWFGGRVRYRPPSWARGRAPLACSPHELCRLGYSQFVLDMVNRSVAQMEITW